jgi:hypothetical protein
VNRAQLTVAVAAGVVVVAAGVALIGSRLSSGGPRTCDIPASVSTGAASSLPGDGIRVVEKGFTQSGVDGPVSLGAVVQNTSHMVAYRTRVTLRVFDSVSPIVEEIPVLLPGQRIGVGGEAPGGTKAGPFRVGLDTTHWLDPAAVDGFEPVTGAYLRTIRPDPQSPATVDVHYTESSPNCRPLVDRGVATVFRDSGGAIVGGALSQPGTLTVFRDKRGVLVGGEQHAPSGDPCDSGTREMWVIPSNPAPDTAAAARTRVYPYCDLALPRNDDQLSAPQN